MRRGSGGSARTLGMRLDFEGLRALYGHWHMVGVRSW